MIEALLRIFNLTQLNLEEPNRQLIQPIMNQNEILGAKQQGARDKNRRLRDDVTRLIGQQRKSKIKAKQLPDTNVDKSDTPNVPRAERLYAKIQPHFATHQKLKDNFRCEICTYYDRLHVYPSAPTETEKKALFKPSMNSFSMPISVLESPRLILYQRWLFK